MTGIAARRLRNVGTYTFGSGALDTLPARLDDIRSADPARARIVYLVDEYFRDTSALLDRLGATAHDRLEIVSTRDEPTTDGIDALVARLLEHGFGEAAAIVGVGGGITLDTAKAVSNLLTNAGSAERYQGWDLVRVPGRYKIGVPTISGTGAEASRTCVMTNPRTHVKLGMNSDHTIFDELILDPDLTATVPRDQFFHTGMDAYIHCVESLSGSHRSPVGDAYSRECLALCRQVFLGDDMMGAESREKLMVASYLGGCAIATSFVGLVHPFSAGLSVVFGLHHCVANCIVLRAMGEFYPEARTEFEAMVKRQGVTIPTGVCRNADDDTHRALHDATVMHEKPLTNALGAGFARVLTREKVRALFEAM
ncbi:iron-containing alcohol dehydrogenase family protein [soil metagenome]